MVFKFNFYFKIHVIIQIIPQIRMNSLHLKNSISLSHLLHTFVLLKHQSKFNAQLIKINIRLNSLMGRGG